MQNLNEFFYKNIVYANLENARGDMNDIALSVNLRKGRLLIQSEKFLYRPMQSY